MPKAGDFLKDEGGVYLAFNSTNEVKKRKLRITVDPVTRFGLERLENESALTGGETIISQTTATALALALTNPSTGSVTYVSTGSEVLEAVSKAKSGDVVVVQDDIELDSVVSIPAGVSLVGYGYQIGSAYPVTVKLKNTDEGVNFKLGAGSILAGFSFEPLEPLSCVVGTFDASTAAEVHYCMFNGTFYEYTNYLGSITLGVSNNVNNKLICTDCKFVDNYTPIQNNGDSFEGGNLTWNSGAVFSAPSLPTLEFIHGIAGAKPASNCDFVSNETVTTEAIKAFCNTLSKTATNMGFRINGTPYTPEETPPVTVPMALPDGSILFYDRGTSYGEYKINDTGYPERIDDAVDDGSAESQNWRYLICDQADISNGIKQWGAYGRDTGLTDTAIGVGLSNTDAMIANYGDNDSYWWKLIKQKRDSTSLKWFMPSKDELNLVYENKTIITGQGGDAFQTDIYYSSSEASIYFIWYQSFSDGVQYDNSKNNTGYCRLLRRV